MKKYIIGVDIGTQGTKSVLFDTSMNIIDTAFESSSLISPRPGVVWQEADDIYSSCVNTIRKLVAGKNIDANQIKAIGVDGQMAGIMGVDKNCNAVTYYDSWLDTRCESYMEEMKLKAGKRIIELTGGPVSYNIGPKILWWKNEKPEIYDNIYKFVLPHGFVVGKMTGLKGEEIYFDYTCIQYSGVGDNFNKEWSVELLDLFGIDKSKMARIVSPFDVVGKTTKEFQTLTGLPAGVPVVAGSGDTACSIFGSGLFETGLLYDCAGTASVMCSVTDSYIPDTQNETLTMMRSPIDGFWFPMAYINGGGLCLKWFRDELTGKPHIDYPELEAEAADIPAGSGGVIFVPHFNGRGFPTNPFVKGSFIGLDWSHHRGHLFSAVLEGISYEYHYYLSVLRRLYPNYNFNKMYIVGGGAKSKLFNSIKSNVLGLDTISFKMAETALIGIGVIAGVGTGLITDYKSAINQVIEQEVKISPDMKQHEQYKAYASTYLNIIDALTPIYKESIYNNKKQ